MLPVKYLGQVIARAAQGTVLMTDRLSVLLAPFATLVLWLFGVRMTDTISETIALGVAITVIATVLLRLLAATYFIWKDDLAEKARLNRIIERPGNAEREAAWNYTISLRNALSESLSRLLAVAELTQIWRASSGKEREMDEYYAEILRSRQLINALSYDVVLRVCAHRLLSTITRLMARIMSGQEVEALEALAQEQKKIAFRVLHKRDFNGQAEMLSMMEMQNLSDEEIYSGPGLDDLDEKDSHAVVDALRESIKDPDVLRHLRAYIESGRSDSL